MSEISLEVLFPNGKELTIHSENLTILPFKFGQLSKVSKIANPLMIAIFAALANPNQIEALTHVMAEGGDNAVQLVAVGTGKSIEWVEQLEMDEGLALFCAVVEVNADFFLRKVLPTLTVELAKIVPPQSGQM